MHKKWFIFIIIVTLAGLACNAPFLAPRPTVPPPPTFAPILVTELPADGLPAATATPLVVNTDQSSTDPLPTFTPRANSTPESNDDSVTAATATIEATATISVTMTPTATLAANIGGTLAFEYTVNWELDPNDTSTALATVTIIPSGGDGTYSYFRDELPVELGEGSAFTYRWAACSSNPGSLRVTSGDGQTLKLDYFETPPCP